ncbi:hypothetical protein ACF3NA_00670 [Alkanindiges sp. WGS2144]|uniref:hypothetical protein n=1 Tax=Alkanindiges sp. WGS2144 TaxID=3366808 RepID=UPI003751413F
MIKPTLLLLPGLLLAASSMTFAAPVTVDATLTSLDCSGDYCQLSFMVNNKPQQAICADEVYCEQWDDADAIPTEFLSKTAKLKIEQVHLEDEGVDADVVSNIQF